MQSEHQANKLRRKQRYGTDEMLRQCRPSGISRWTEHIDHWFSRSDFLEKSQKAPDMKPHWTVHIHEPTISQLGNLIQAAAINLLKAPITCKNSPKQRYLTSWNNLEATQSCFEIPSFPCKRPKRALDVAIANSNGSFLIQPFSFSFIPFLFPLKWGKGMERRRVGGGEDVKKQYNKTKKHIKTDSENFSLMCLMDSTIQMSYHLLFSFSQLQSHGNKERLQSYIFEAKHTYQTLSDGEIQQNKLGGLRFSQT